MVNPAELPDCLTYNFAANCSDIHPACRNPAGFEFKSLFALTQRIVEQCSPEGSPLLKRSGEILSLSNPGCKWLAGAKWTHYPMYQVWNRLVQWKFPLFQLVATSPRPPLGIWEETFCIVHLLGDPIGSIQDLIWKTESCQRRLRGWRGILHRADLNLLFPAGGEAGDIARRQLAEALTLITISYDEFGAEKGDLCRRILESQLKYFSYSEIPPDHRRMFIRICRNTAATLAADRGTKFLPMLVAQGFFISGVVIAIAKTKSAAAGPSSQVYINIEVFSIAFTALFFWVIFAVLLASVIGTSQTANAIPRALDEFRETLRQGYKELGIVDRQVVALPKGLMEDKKRCWRGGIYSCQPEKVLGTGLNDKVGNDAHHERKPEKPPTSTWRKITSRLHAWPWLCTFLAFLSVALAVLTGMTLTALVPPEGWSCRTAAQLTIFVVWLISYPITLFLNLNTSDPQRRFWLVFVKDIGAIGGTLGYVIAAQFGLFNRCDCFDQNGQCPVAFPQEPLVAATLEHRLDVHYPAITMVGIVLQLVVLPMLVVVRYRGALLVFLQRDDGTKVLEWWFGDWWVAKWRAFKDRVL